MTYDPSRQVVEHSAQWHRFTRLLVVCSAAVALTLVLMALFPV
jgi:hypothetical protein